MKFSQCMPFKTNCYSKKWPQEINMIDPVLLIYSDINWKPITLSAAFLLYLMHLDSVKPRTAGLSKLNTYYHMNVVTLNYNMETDLNVSISSCFILTCIFRISFQLNEEKHNLSYNSAFIYMQSTIQSIVPLCGHASLFNFFPNLFHWSTRRKIWVQINLNIPSVETL